jgi:hypothetical protein
MYINFRRRLRNAVTRKLPEKWRTNSLGSPHNAPTHRSGLVKDFLAENNVITLEHLPYTSDLAAADFYLSPQLKSALNGRRLCDDTDKIKNATEELKSLSQNGFQEVSNTFTVDGRSV